MFKFSIKNISPVLALFLLLALVLPSVLMPSAIQAEDIEVYALIQVPNAEKEDSLKSAVVSVLDFKNGHAIVGCTDAQLNALPGDGYAVIDDCSGSEGECWSQLSTLLDSLPPLVGAPIPAVGGASAGFNYSFIDSNTAGGPGFYWIDISGTGTNTGIHCDDCGVVVPIGFTFNFDGNEYATIGISSNGYLTFGTDISDYSNECIPYPYEWDPNDAILVFWDDLYSRCEDSDIYYETRFVNGRQVFIVQWVGNQFCCGCPQPYRLNFEAILFEDSNAILFQYNEMTGGGTRINGSSATVGLENIYRTAGLQYSCNSPVIEDSLAILFCPGNNAGGCVQTARLDLPTTSSQPKRPARAALPPTPALIVTNYLDINPKEVYSGQTVTISASMANDGDSAGGYTADLKINGQMEQVKVGDIDGHSSVPVMFTVSRSQPGTYNVEMGGQKGSFTVLAPETNSSSSSVSPTLAIVIIGVMVLCAAGVLALALRRTA